MDDKKSPINILEAMLFAATEPLDEPTLLSKLPEGSDIKELLPNYDHITLPEELIW